MHFGKNFIENSDEETDIRSFLLGLVSPDTFDSDEDFEEYHCYDEDGNIDVREFYERFDMDVLSLQQRSFVLGYYCHLWLDEYYKFNASRLVVHNSRDLTDDELSEAVKNIVKYYDSKVVGSYYDSIKNSIQSYDLKLKLGELKHISVKWAKEKLSDYFSEELPKDVYTDLIDEEEYVDFIGSSCSKFMKSME